MLSSCMAEVPAFLGEHGILRVRARRTETATLLGASVAWFGHCRNEYFIYDYGHLDIQEPKGLTEWDTPSIGAPQVAGIIRISFVWTGRPPAVDRCVAGDPVRIPPYGQRRGHSTQCAMPWVGIGQMRIS